MRKNIRLADQKKKDRRPAPAKKNATAKPAGIPAPIAVKSVQLAPIEALELRQIEFSVVAAQASLQTLLNIRKARSEAIASRHGIDITTGSWHLDADLGTISAIPPKE